MKHLWVASIIVLFASFNASASPSDLVGKWIGPCNETYGAKEFTATLSEFKSNGTIESGNLVYGDAQCSGPLIRTEQTDTLNYTADATSLQFSGLISGSQYELFAEYQINGNEMTVSLVKVVVGGREQTPSAEYRTTVLKRVQ
jgi:hypothetical protein